MRLVKLTAPEGCTPAVDLTLEERASVLRRAGVEFAFHTEGDIDNGEPVWLHSRTRYPVHLEDYPGGGYLVAENRPTYILPEEEGDVGDNDLDKRVREGMTWLKSKVATFAQAQAFMAAYEQEPFWTPFDYMGWCLSRRVLAGLLADVLEGYSMPSGRHYCESENGADLYYGWEPEAQ